MFGLFEKDQAKQQKYKLAEAYAKQKVKELGFFGIINLVGFIGLLISVLFSWVVVLFLLLIVSTLIGFNVYNNTFITLFFMILLTYKDVKDKAFFKFYNDKKRELGI